MRARRSSQQFWSAEDRDRALRFAEELDAQAEELERTAFTANHYAVRTNDVGLLALGR